MNKIQNKGNNASLDEILQQHFGCKKVFLKQPYIVGYWTCGEPEPDYEYMTRTGGRAYKKLVALIYDLEALLGESMVDSHRIISELDSIVSSNPY